MFIVSKKSRPAFMLVVIF